MDEVTLVLVETPGPTSVVTDRSSPIEVVYITDVQLVVEQISVQQIIDATAPTVIITESRQGPPGRDGASAGGAGVFILDIVSLTGVTGQKVYNPNTVPANTVLTEVTTDTPSVRVYVGCNGGSDNYSPTITVNGVPAVLTETGTKRWFTGYADVPVSAPSTLIRAVSGVVEQTAIVHLAGAGPAVTAVDVGPYPGVQTALKAGDHITLLISTELEAVSATITGPTITRTVPVVNGRASVSITLDNSTGLQPFSVSAKNALGTTGALLVSASVLLDQIAPTFGPFTVTYPNGHAALNTGESATVACTVLNADDVVYGGTGLTVVNSLVQGSPKTVGHVLSGYQTATYTVLAHKAANDSSASAATSIQIATVAPTARLQTVPSGRLASSPMGVDYTVVLTPSQALLTAPLLNPSAGMWQGGWALVGSTWQRILRIADSVPRGPALFSGLSLVGPSGIAGSVITSGAAYVVGGFSPRTVTFAAFSRVAALGVSVGDPTKLSAQIVGGNVLTVQTSNAVVANGFYPADIDGSYRADGAYIGLSDSAFAGSNTSGTLQVSVQEIA
jgi:hypothetical protein